jgi:asparagine synthase (glutamine-hydrolysing)
MCGFVVTIGDFEPGAAKLASEKIVHRGPDELGIFDFRNIQIATRRLSIQDSEGGKQPFTDFSKRRILAYNGEIFNSRILRNKLTMAGAKFCSSHSDTETLFNLLSHNRLNLLEEINGMFAFAFLDLEEKSLMLARDFAGQKPLYWSLSSKGLIVSSEIEPIKFLLRPLAYNLKSLANFIEYGYIPFDQTVFKEISKLQPGDILNFDIENFEYTIKNFSQLSPFNYSSSKSTNLDIETLNELIVEASVNWATSDVPIAISLSDGIDSSLIVSILANKLGKSFSTYSLSYKSNAEQFVVNSKLPAKYGLEHHEITIGPDNVKADLFEMIKSLGEPYGGGLPSWFIYKEIAKKCKVAITGSGADELFGNYGKSKLVSRINKFNKFGLYKNFQKLVQTTSNSPDFKANSRGIVESIEKKLIIEDGTFLNKISYLDSINLFSYGEFKRINHDYSLSRFKSLEDYIFCFDFNLQLAEEFLFMTDRFSMHFSVESRTPFLDHELVKYISSFDRNMVTKRDSKYYLKEVGKKWLDEELLIAPKKGFIIPEYSLLKSELNELFNRYLSEEYIKSAGILDFKIVELWKNRFDHEPRNNYLTNMVWRIFMLQLWLNEN